MNMNQVKAIFKDLNGMDNMLEKHNAPKSESGRITSNYLRYWLGNLKILS